MVVIRRNFCIIRSHNLVSFGGLPPNNAETNNHQNLKRLTSRIIQQLQQITTSWIPSAHNYCEYCQKPLGHVMELVDCSFGCCWHLTSAKLLWLRGSKIRLKPFIMSRTKAAWASGMSYGQEVWLEDYLPQDACFTMLQDLCFTLNMGDGSHASQRAVL